jgi:hypothetical protein
MSDYTKATNFTAKDSLPTGNAGKIVKGTEIDTEFTAIASAIASKADTNSPAFTGTPVAPTATAGTNTTQVATTAHVFAERTNTATLTNKTLTSPTINTPTITGGTITDITDLTVADGGTGVSTIAANAVVLGNGTSAIQTVAPSTSGNVLTSNGTTWSSSALSSLAVFDKSLSANGYQKLPGGLIIQWGESGSVANDSSIAVTLPISFPSACVSVQITGNKVLATTGAGIQTVQSLSTTGFQINNGQDTAMTFYWIAIGY